MGNKFREICERLEAYNEMLEYIDVRLQDDEVSIAGRVELYSMQNVISRRVRDSLMELSEILGNI